MADKPDVKKRKPSLSAGNIARFTILVAGIFVLLRIFYFHDIEFYCVASCSMEPTLYGDAENGDRILVNRLAYKIGDPKRWDVAVFEFPENIPPYFAEGGKTYIKRIVGMPGDTLEIKGGEIYLWDREQREFIILRKPDDIQKILWHTIFNQQFHNPKPDWSFGKHWRAEDGEIVYDGESESKASEITLEPSSTGGDLLIAFDIRVESGQGGVGVRLQEDLDAEGTHTDISFEVRLATKSTPYGTWSPTVHVNGQNLTDNLPKLEPKRTYSIEMSNVDDKVTFKLDGKTIYSKTYSEDNPQTLPTPKITISAAGIHASLTNMIIQQDVYYTSENGSRQIAYGNPGNAVKVLADNYFVLGDNSALSSDSRMWGLVPRNHMIGRAFFILRPLNRLSFIK